MGAVTITADPQQLARDMGREGAIRQYLATNKALNAGSIRSNMRDSEVQMRQITWA
jgi:hypothetical protein